MYLFLHNILKLDSDKAQAEANKMRAALDDETLNKLVVYTHNTLGLDKLDCGYDIGKEKCINCLRRKGSKING